MSCAVRGCSNVRRFRPEGITFHRFPRNELLFKKWLKSLKLSEEYSWSVNKFVCSNHFKATDFIKTDKQIRLKLSAVPRVEIYCAEEVDTPSTSLVTSVTSVQNHIQTEHSYSLSSSAATSTPLTTDPFKLFRDIQEPDVETTFELLPQLSEQPVLNVADKQNPTYKGHKDVTYCRLCLKPLDKDSLTPLNVIDIDNPGKSDILKKKKADEMKEIQKMIKLCLPFLDSLTFNPIICSMCLARLRCSYDFANECLKNQRFIKKYVYGITEVVVNINDIIESKFSLSDDRASNIDAEVPTPNIPEVIKSNSGVSQQMKGEYLHDGPFKKRQKIYNGSHEEDPLTSLNEDTLNIKTKTCENNGYASKEFLSQDVQIRDIDPDNVAEESIIKIEQDDIDSPVFVKPEVEDDLHVENLNKMFNKGMGIETDNQEQHSDSYGMKNVAVDEINVPSFTTGSVVPTLNILKVIESNSRVSQQMKGEYLHDGLFKNRQKIYNGSHEEDPLTSLNNDTLNIKTKTCENNGYASKEFLTQDVQISYIDLDNVAEEIIKIEPDDIDSPVCVKPELVDDLHVEYNMFNKGMGIETDNQEQHSDSYRMKNVAVDETNVPSFTTGSVISNEYIILETVPLVLENHF